MGPPMQLTLRSAQPFVLERNHVAQSGECQVGIVGLHMPSSGYSLVLRCLFKIFYLFIYVIVHKLAPEWTFLHCYNNMYVKL